MLDTSCIQMDLGSWEKDQASCSADFRGYKILGSSFYFPALIHSYSSYTINIYKTSIHNKIPVIPAKQYLKTQPIHQHPIQDI